MNIVDSFLMSDSSESDLLWVKLNLEKNVVSKWIIQENAYNLKGEYKGLYVSEVLKKERFKEFLPKIVNIYKEEQLNPGCSDEHNNFCREKWQRTLCYPHLMETTTDDTLVLISDVDESIDFDNEQRKEKFLKSVRQDRITWVKRRRFWYDYDNEAKLYNIRIPIVPMCIIRDHPDALYMARHNHDDDRTFGSYEDSIAYEYSYCFKTEKGVNDKKKNYSHTGFTEECVKGGLFLNVWPRSKQRGEKIRWDGEDIFEMIPLHEGNSPQFVRDNLYLLKTNIVDPNYIENRKTWTSEFTE